MLENVLLLTLALALLRLLLVRRLRALALKIERRYYLAVLKSGPRTLSSISAIAVLSAAPLSGKILDALAGLSCGHEQVLVQLLDLRVQTLQR